MKRIFSFIICILLIIPLVSCGKDTPIPISDPLLAKKTALHDKLQNNNYILDEQKEDKFKPWAQLWTDEIYNDYGLTNVTYNYLSGANYWHFSESLEVCVILYSIEFQSEKPVPGAIKNDKNLSEVKIGITAIKENTKYILSGYMAPGEFEEYNAIEKVYALAKEDKRYSSKLNAFPEVKLPNSFTRLAMPNTNISHWNRAIHPITENTLAIIYEEAIKNSNTPLIHVALYDIKTKKTTKDIEIGNYLFSTSKAISNKLYLSVFKDDPEKMEIFYVDSKGNKFSEKHPDGVNSSLLSPDGSKYIYSSNCNLFLVDKNSSQEPKLLLKGNPEGVETSFSFYPFRWLDNSSFIYGINGYEWSYGCGIYNIDTNTDRFLEEAGRYALPIEFINGKLYKIESDNGGLFDPYIVDLTGDSYTSKPLFSDKSLIENQEINSYAFSQDGKSIALLKTTTTPYGSSKLYICSTEDGSILKTYEFQTGFNIPSNLHYLSPDKLLIGSTRYAYSPEYMYIVDLSK